MELLKPGSKIDFVGKRYIAGAGSGLLVLLSILAFFIIGPNWGIDFTGGSEVIIQFEDDVEISAVRDALATINLPSDAVQRINAPEDHEFSIRIQDAGFGSADLEKDILSTLSTAYGADWIVDSRFDAQVGGRLTVEHKPPEVQIRDVTALLEKQGITGALAQESPDDNTFYVKMPGLASQVEKSMASLFQGRAFKILQVDSVGPKVGGDLRRQAFISMAATLGLVLLYVGFRFDLAFAPGAILALFHDVAITIGVFTVAQQEINLSMIGALLTIIGYSLNDTIVIYDRIRENMQRYRRNDMAALINDSINETLGRTIATSVTTAMALVAFLVWGGPVIGIFAEAMLIGVVVGTYSTIFVASPSILFMEKVKPHLIALMTPAGTGVEIPGESSSEESR
ncbi:MAG: protein translocase subunit SecF [Alphaproteobacteria bacterium]|nr:protein translocase subunit SecF [Alphaproteobacteria bacterium]MCB9791656.1 protein translocase subunit SecF [Alphaproteobacteria bacterium]